MKTIICAIACFLSVAVTAQNTYSSNLKATALATSVVKLNKNTSELNGNVLLNRLPASAAPHNGAHGAGIALLVLGPVKMAVGLGVLSWAGAHYNYINRNREPGAPRAFDQGVGFGIGLGTFHLLTGAALTAGGVVLLRKGRGQSSGVYMTIPEPVAPNSATGNASGMGMRTSIVF